MTETIGIPRSLIDIVNNIEPEGDIKDKVKHILENELIRRLNRYALTIKHLEKKYGVSLSKFKKKGVVVKKGYSYEVENDLWEWESSIDGIKTVNTEIKRLKTLR